MHLGVACAVCLQLRRNLKFWQRKQVHTHVYIYTQDVTSYLGLETCALHARCCGHQRRWHSAPSQTHPDNPRYQISAACFAVLDPWLRHRQRQENSRPLALCARSQTQALLMQAASREMSLLGKVGNMQDNPCSPRQECLHGVLVFSLSTCASNSSPDVLHAVLFKFSPVESLPPCHPCMVMQGGPQGQGFKGPRAPCPMPPQQQTSKSSQKQAQTPCRTP